jgi:hypothetical protein
VVFLNTLVISVQASRGEEVAFNLSIALNIMKRKVELEVPQNLLLYTPAPVIRYQSPLPD